MRKFWWSALICLAVINCSCSDDLDAQEFQPIQAETRNPDVIKLTEIQQKALDIVYAYCAEFYKKELGEAAYVFECPTNEEKVAVIRFCDYCIDKGDEICEIPEFDYIRDIIWPDGYGVFRK